MCRKNFFKKKCLITTFVDYFVKPTIFIILFLNKDN